MEKRDYVGEVKDFLKGFFSGYKWYLLIIPFISVGSVYLADAYRETSSFADWWMIKGNQEAAAVIVLFLAFSIYLRRYFYLERKQSRLTLVFMLLTLSFWCREMHFRGTHTGIWVAVILISLWALWQAGQLKGELISSPEKSFFSAAILLYLVSQLIERRVFRESRLPLLPDEARLHVMLEEVTENFGHLMIFLSALFGIKRHDRPKKVDE